MRKSLFLLVAVLTLGSYALAAPKKTPAKKPLPVWKPAPALVKQLATQLELPFGTIRLPRGYVHYESPLHFTIGTVLSWAKKSARGEPNTTLVLMQVPAEELALKNTSLESFLRSYMEGFNQGFSKVQRTSAKQGKVNGLRTLRTDWTGVYRWTGIKYKGTIFVMKDATDIYVIQTGHKINYLSEQRLTETSALTFKIQSEN